MLGWVDPRVIRTLDEEIKKIEEMKKKEEEQKDKVNSPAHYTKGDIECIDAIKASMTHEAFMGYMKGNAMKYLWRYEDKGNTEDLRKCQWYLQRLTTEMGE